MTIALNQLGAGQAAQIHNVAAPAPLRRRLIDLGLVPGTPVQRVVDSPAGDPTCYRVRGAMIALRKADAALITVSL